MSDKSETTDPANIRLHKDTAGWVLEWDILTPGNPVHHIRRLPEAEAAAIHARGMALAVLLSGIVGAALDSLLFSALAFGTVAWAPGLILAKLYASAAYALWLAARQRRAVA
jgi:hypothetical protein